MPSFLQGHHCCPSHLGLTTPPKGLKGNNINDLIVEPSQGGKTANLRKGVTFAEVSATCGQ